MAKGKKERGKKKKTKSAKGKSNNVSSEGSPSVQPDPPPPRRTSKTVSNLGP